VLAASFAALRSGGVVLFTLERSTANQRGQQFILHPTGRYSHAESYIDKLMPDCGFRQLSISHDSIRIEIGKAVPGLVVSARKP
jgi:predicted TPR repeat methyltransferase